MSLRLVMTAILVSAGVSACSSSPSEADRKPVEQPAETNPAEEPTEVEEEPEPNSPPESVVSIDLDDPPPADSADGVAARIAKAHGAGAFDAFAQATFTFAVVNAGQDVFEARLVWDKESDRARVTWRDAKAKADVVAMVHLDDRSKGWVVVNDKPATEEQRATYLEAAYGRWVNDSYWAFMPQKIVDPGVNRTLEAQQEVDGKPHDVIKLTYEGVGLTPGDTYWVYADAKTHVVNRWDMLLEGAKPDAEPTAVRWLDHRDISGVVVAHDHEIVETPRRIVIRDVSFADSVDSEMFDEP